MKLLCQTRDIYYGYRHCTIDIDTAMAARLLKLRDLWDRAHEMNASVSCVDVMNKGEDPEWFEDVTMEPGVESIVQNLEWALVPEGEASVTFREWIETYFEEVRIGQDGVSWMGYGGIGHLETQVLSWERLAEIAEGSWSI